MDGTQGKKYVCAWEASKMAGKAMLRMGRHVVFGGSRRRRRCRRNSQRETENFTVVLNPAAAVALCYSTGKR